MNQGSLTDPAFKPDDESPTASDEGTRYLRLLDEDAEPQLWEDFLRDIRNACLKKPDLQPAAEDWAQEIVEIVIRDLPKLRREGKNPWFYGLRVMKVKTYEAIRKNIKARTHEALTGSSIDIQEKICEVEESGVDQNEETFIRNFEECLMVALKELPARKTQLIEDYYSLRTHDRKKREGLVESYHLASYTSLQTMISRISDDLVEKVDKCMEQRTFSFSKLLTGKEGRGRVKKYIKKLFSAVSRPD